MELVSHTNFLGLKRGFDKTEVILKKLSAICIGIFVILSILSSDNLQAIRIIFYAFFFIFSFLRLRINKTPIKYQIITFLILVLSIITFFRGFQIYGSVSLLEAKLIILYFFVFSTMTLFTTSYHLKVVENSILVGAILLSIYFFYMFLGLLKINPIFLGDFLEQNYNLELRGRVKLYGNNISILTFIFPFLFIKTLIKDGNQKINFIALILTGLCSLISLRRGVILSGLLGIFLTTLLLSLNNRKLFIRIVKILVIFFLLMVVYFTVSIAKYDQYKDEITSSVDFEKNHSNVIRKTQFNFFIEKIKKRPFFGYGLGAHDINYIRNKNNPAHYELGYLKMIYAGGLTIFLLNFALFAWGLLTAKNLITKSKETAKKITPVLAGWISLVIYHASNPIFSQFSYLFFYFYAFYMIINVRAQKWKT